VPKTGKDIEVKSENLRKSMERGAMHQCGAKKWPGGGYERGTRTPGGKKKNKRPKITVREKLKPRGEKTPEKCKMRTTKKRDTGTGHKGITKQAFNNHKNRPRG